MSAYTAIEYADSSYNAMSGCTGCELWNSKVRTCYAGRMTEEYAGAKGWPKRFEEPTMFEGRMDKAIGMVDLRGKDREHKPWLNGRPRHIFLNDMGDVHSKTIPRQWIADEIIKKIGSPKGSRHIFFMFSKRATEQAEFIKWYRDTQGVLPANIVWMTSVTSPATLKRLETLLEIPNIIRGVSLEPLLARMTGLMKVIVKGTHDLNWIVTGSESDPNGNHRPCDEDWIREIRDVAAELEIPFFLKQLVDSDGSKRSVPLLDGVRHVAMPTVIGDNLF